MVKGQTQSVSKEFIFVIMTLSRTGVHLCSALLFFPCLISFIISSFLHSLVVAFFGHMRGWHFCNIYMCDHRTEREDIVVCVFYQFAYLCIHGAKRESEIGLVHGTMCNVHGCRWLLTRSLSTVTTALVLSWAPLSSLNPCVLSPILR